MTNIHDDNNYVTVAFTIPPEWKERIDRAAIEQDLNRSQVVRRILREHFEREDSPKAAAARKTPQAA